MKINNRALVSVVIPVYNAERYITQTVRSVMEQTYDNLEVIVVDDGSMDNTIKCLKEFEGRIKIFKQSNKGVSLARNNGVGVAKGDFIAFLDADDLWMKDKIEKQMSVFSNSSEVSLVACCAEKINENDRKIINANDEERSGIYDHSIDLRRELLMRGNPIILSSVLMKRSLFNDVQGFNTQKNVLSEDYDFWIRASAKGLFYVMSERLTSYRVLEHSRIHGTLQKEYISQKEIIEMHREQYTPLQYRRRMAWLYYAWADSAAYQGDPQALALLKECLYMDPFHYRAYALAVRVVIKNSLRFIGLMNNSNVSGDASGKRI